MYLCYIDESGTSAIPGNTSHFILAGLSIPIWHWRDCDRDISNIKKKYDLTESEIHTAWIARKYLEQDRISNFKSFSHSQRRAEVQKARNRQLLNAQRPGNSKQYRQLRKNFKRTEGYIHLTFQERQQLLLETAQCVSNWGFARIFAECIDKIHFDPARSRTTIDIQAFEQVTSRFEQYLESIPEQNSRRNYGLLIHDNNETVNKKHTALMKHFHKQGTLWTKINHIIETPLFVDSELTSMVQIADLCSYAIRRYLENAETELFDLIFTRADRKYNLTVGVRHFSRTDCSCKICSEHRY